MICKQAAYLAACVRAIAAIRARFHAFKGHALILRSGADPFEGGGCTDLSIAILQAAACDNAVSLTFHGYPSAGHDILFEGCTERLSMAAGKNGVADDIVSWLSSQVAR